MYCKVTIDMLNPNTRVKEMPTRSTYGEITNAYKFLSTSGHPGMDKRHVTDQIQNFENPECSLGGLVCFSEPHTDRPFFYPDSGLVAFGTKYSSDYSSFSSKYGKKDTSATEIKPGYCSQTWEFDTNQGNGSIKSVGLTHIAGAHCMDNVDFTASATPNIGSDFSLAVPLNPDADAISDQGIPMLKQTSTAGYNIKHYIPYIRYFTSNSTWSSVNLFYISDNYIVIFGDITYNASSGGSYITTLKYRRIPKKDFYKYFEMSVYSRSISPLRLRHDSTYDATYEEGQIQINSGSLQLHAPMQGYVVQDCAYLPFYAVTSTTTLASGEVNASGRSARGGIFYVVSGDTPVVTQYATTLATNLCSSTATQMGSSMNGAPVFFKDMSVAYGLTSGSTYRIIHRKLSGATLIKSSSYSSGVMVRYPFNFKNMYAVIKSASALNSTYHLKQYKGEVFNSDTDELLGYLVYTTRERDTDATAPIDYFAARQCGPITVDTNNPVVAMAGGGALESNCAFPFCYALSNYLGVRANFVTPIEKTSDYIMRVKVELFLT